MRKGITEEDIPVHAEHYKKPATMKHIPCMPVFVNSVRKF
jgi:hypothetical protein